MKNFIYYGKVFKDLSTLMKVAKEREWHPHENHLDRLSCPVAPDEILDPQVIYDVYTDFIGEYHTFDLTPSWKTVDCKLAKYYPGMEMDWHDDYGNPVAYTNQSRPWGRRQITSITYLNDDYEGGATVFRDGTTITPRAGETLIFPSHWCFRHRGRKVSSGIKLIFIEHLWG